MRNEPTANLGFMVQVSITAIRLIPLPSSLPPDGVALFIVCTLVGLFTLFFR